MSNATTHFKYRFFYSDGREFNHEVVVDNSSKIIIGAVSTNEDYDEITNLEYCKCENCPLDASRFPKCPAAVHMIGLVENFSDLVSHETLTVEVESENRIVKKTTSAQQALQSIMGVVMATSGCPHLEFLAPMALHHLPFSNDQETMVRVLGFYFVEQFLRNPDGKLQVEDLKERYAKVEIVNHHFIKRINELEKRDAGRNALVILDTFIKLFSMEYSMDLVSLKEFFFKPEEKIYYKPC